LGKKGLNEAIRNCAAATIWAIPKSTVDSFLPVTKKNPGGQNSKAIRLKTNSMTSEPIQRVNFGLMKLPTTFLLDIRLLRQAEENDDMAYPKKFDETETGRVLQSFCRKLRRHIEASLSHSGDDNKFKSTSQNDLFPTAETLGDTNEYAFSIPSFHDRWLSDFPDALGNEKPIDSAEILWKMGRCKLRYLNLAAIVEEELEKYRDANPTDELDPSTRLHRIVERIKEFNPKNPEFINFQYPEWNKTIPDSPQRPPSILEDDDESQDDRRQRFRVEWESIDPWAASDDDSSEDEGNESEQIEERNSINTEDQDGDRTESSFFVLPECKWSLQNPRFIGKSNANI
jgi:hypothetical protein